MRTADTLIWQVMVKAALTLEDVSAYNILFLGPTGSGKLSFSS